MAQHWTDRKLAAKMRMRYHRGVTPKAEIDAMRVHANEVSDLEEENERLLGKVKAKAETKGKAEPRKPDKAKPKASKPVDKEPKVKPVVEKPKDPYLKDFYDEDDS